ncbi:hypothetical protein Agub_g6872, partial [Astrephomene gubernaculifera]
QANAAEDDGWAEVSSGRGKKGGGRKSTSTYAPLHHQLAQHAQQTAAASAAAASVAAATAAGSSSSSSTTAAAAAAGTAAAMAVVLGGKPLVPSMLNGIVAAFNPRISIAAPAATTVGGGAGRPSMAQLVSKGGPMGRAALLDQQEQQDAQEFFQFLVNRAHEEVVALRKAHGLVPEAAAGAGGSGASAGGGADGG